MQVTAAPGAWQEDPIVAMGRPTMFKKDGPDVHGRVSKAAAEKFELARKKLAKIYREVEGVEWKGKISDGDVIEFLIRGDVSTRLAFKGEI